MSDALKYVNLTVEGWGLLFCLLSAAILLIATKIDRATRRYFLAIFSLLFLYLISNIGGLLLRGQTEPLRRALLRLANFSEYFFGDLLTLTLTLYLLHLIGRGRAPISPCWRRAAYGMFWVAVALLLLSQKLGLFYFLDANSIYHRGPFFWLSQVLAILSLVLDVALILRYHDRLTRIERISFCVYVTVPIVAIVLQLFFYGIYFLLLASTLAAVFMLGAIVLDETERYYQTEQELAQMRSSLVLSQVRPHFLYNSLTVIAQLCEQSPAEAKQATLAFSEYLRTNMNSLTGQKNVPFSTELQHIKTYLYLEQLRFGEELQVRLDIQAEDFYLPALSIQPLVENAVKWGVGQKEEGGTITLSTRPVPGGVELTVEDDGVGFDPQKPPADGRTHFGLQLVRDRLQMLCGATLTVQSRPGHGTKVRLFLPKTLD